MSGQQSLHGRGLEASRAGASRLLRRRARAVAHDDASRRALALVAVAEVEALETILPTARERHLVGGGRILARPDLPARLHSMLPSPWRHHWDPTDPVLEQVDADTGADLVVRAKYDLSPTVKLRAAYDGAGLVLGVLPVGAAGSCGATRTVRAHVLLGRYAPDLAPELVSFGETRASGRYVIERWVDGRPLMTPARLARAVPEIVEGLQGLHAGHGISRIRLSRWAPDLAADWAVLRGGDLVPEPLGRRVAELIQRDGTLRCSWTHGDPVSSNVLETESGIVLIDWENAATAPVMVDGAKLHLFAGEPRATLSIVLAGLGAVGPTASGEHAYSPQEELALVHARALTAHPGRAAQLVGHPRAEAHARQGRRRVERLAEALDA